MTTGGNPLADAALDSLLAARVSAHQRRADGTLTVPAYLAELRRVRAGEDALEAERQQCGARVSRALELVALESGAMGDRARAHIAERAGR
jgi:hypothetical protein